MFMGPCIVNQCSSNFSTIAEGSRDGLNSARCCNYSYICSWWRVELPPETCRSVDRNIINCILSHLIGQLLTYYLTCTVLIQVLFDFTDFINFIKYLVKNKKNKWTVKGEKILSQKASRLEWEIFCAWVGIIIPCSQWRVYSCFWNGAWFPSALSNITPTAKGSPYRCAFSHKNLLPFALSRPIF
jgi:hypothetical protein